MMKPEPRDIVLTFRPFGGSCETRKAKTIASARAFILQRLGACPDIETGWAVALDGSGTVHIRRGATMREVFAHV